MSEKLIEIVKNTDQLQELKKSSTRVVKSFKEELDEAIKKVTKVFELKSCEYAPDIYLQYEFMRAEIKPLSPNLFKFVYGDGTVCLEVFAGSGSIFPTRLYIEIYKPLEGGGKDSLVRRETHLSELTHDVLLRNVRDGFSIYDMARRGEGDDYVSHFFDKR